MYLALLNNWWYALDTVTDGDSTHLVPVRIFAYDDKDTAEAYVAQNTPPETVTEDTVTPDTPDELKEDTTSE